MKRSQTLHELKIHEQITPLKTINISSEDSQEALIELHNERNAWLLNHQTRQKKEIEREAEIGKSTLANEASVCRCVLNGNSREPLSNLVF